VAVVPVIERDPSINVRRALGAFRNGSRDATTRIAANEFWRATFTPLGPATIHLTWTTTEVRSEAWGPGADWLLHRVSAMCGLDDPGFRFETTAHRHITDAQRNYPGLRFGASGTLYHELLPAILGQRVTTIEATRQWTQLCRKIGEPAPGPDPSLHLPPHPDRLADQPAWWFHPLGIEAKRAEGLKTIARHHDKIQQWCSLDVTDAAARLALLNGVGAWTVAIATSSAFGDPDAVAVGDYHLKNMVSWAFTGKARGTDERMLELLEPYRGQRNRVLQLLGSAGLHAPKFGPKQRIQPMHRR
jgi:3-methyladenine DNA glycosylase/8-oxoguanine DNA glycosylase